MFTGKDKLRAEDITTVLMDMLLIGVNTVAMLFNINADKLHLDHDMLELLELTSCDVCIQNHHFSSKTATAGYRPNSSRYIIINV